MHMTPRLATVASLWCGPYLSFLERVVIQSYLDHGHHFILYVTEPLIGIPEGVDIRNAADIAPPPAFDISDNDRLRVAVYSDIFRLKLLMKTDHIWSDLDAYCVQPLEFDTEWIFGFGRSDQACTGVLKLPRQSQTLAKMLEFVSAPCPIQPWRGARLQRIRQKQIDNGEIWGIQDLPWGCSGPKAFTYFLKQTEEISHCMDKDVFYPLYGETLPDISIPNLDLTLIEKPASHSVHIFGSTKKLIRAQGGLPPHDSYLDMICQRHGIDPVNCPVK